MKVCQYSSGLARAKFKGSHQRLYTLTPGSTLQGFSVFAEKNAVYVKIPKGHDLAIGLSEGDFFGHEILVLVTAEHVNPALFGRE